MSTSKYTPKTNTPLLEPPTAFETELLNCCKELRAVTAACFTVIGKLDDPEGVVAAAIATELEQHGVTPGFGERANRLIVESEARHPSSTVD